MDVYTASVHGGRAFICSCGYWHGVWDDGLRPEHREILVALDALEHVRDSHPDETVSVHVSSSASDTIRNVNTLNYPQEIADAIRKASILYRLLNKVGFGNGTSNEALKFAKLVATLRR